MKSIINYILGKLPVVEQLNGKKTLIGAGLIFLSYAIGALQQVAVLFPETSWIGDTAQGLSSFFDSAQSALDYLGITFIGVGFAHKKVKTDLAKR